MFFSRLLLFLCRASDMVQPAAAVAAAAFAATAVAASEVRAAALRCIASRMQGTEIAASTLRLQPTAA
jgi:hypothetical protein